jgi:hypothetical protein
MHRERLFERAVENRFASGVDEISQQNRVAFGQRLRAVDSRSRTPSRALRRTPARSDAAAIL